MEQKFGLIIKKKPQAAAAAAPQRTAKAVFASTGESDDEEQLDERSHINYTLMREAEKNKEKAKKDIERVMEEDASVYAYDEVYDDMAATKALNDPRLQKFSKDKDPPKAKYIGQLLQSAADRKLQDELRKERQVQREREKEGEMYADKEAFVTGAYKRKMEELKRLEEEERRAAAVEAANEVTKKGDLSGFYRNLLTKNVAMGGAAATKPTPAPSDAAAAAPASSSLSSSSSSSSFPAPRPADSGAARSSSSDAPRTHDGQSEEQPEMMEVEPAPSAAQKRPADDEPIEGPAAPAAQDETQKYARKTTEDTVMSARDRAAARRQERKNRALPVAEE